MKYSHDNGISINSVTKASTELQSDGRTALYIYIYYPLLPNAALSSLDARMSANRAICSSAQLFRTLSASASSPGKRCYRPTLNCPGLIVSLIGPLELRESDVSRL